MLLVVDEKDFLENLYSRLSKSMKVLVASSAEEAFSLLKNQPIAVIVSDERMPGLSGHELLDEVSRRWPDVIRILLTGYDDVRKAQKSLDKGDIYKYLPKTTSFVDIEVLIKNGLSLFESEEKQRQALRAKQEYLKNIYVEEHLLPESTPHIPGLYFDTYYQSAQEVGGDYFDFIDIDSRHLGIVVADVSGKGLESSMLMASVCHTLRSQAGLSLSPREVIDETENMLSTQLSMKHFVTLFYAILDRQTMTLKCANAGHPPLLLGNKKTDEIQWIHPKGLAIGLGRFKKLSGTLEREEVDITLNPGDFLFFYTDGVTEVRNSDNDCFGRKRLEEFLLSHRDSLLIVHQLKAALEHFAEGAPQQDDVTAVYLERCAV